MRLLFCCFLALSAGPFDGCSQRAAAPAAPGQGRAIATFKGGEVTRGELDREAARLPPLLQKQFQTKAGKRELAMSIVDKKLLAGKARAAGLTQDAEIRRQVQELEDRLTVQALLARQEQALPPPSEADERGYYDSHKEELADPEKVKLGRVLVEIPAAAQRAAAKSRADKLHKALASGAPLAKIAAQGDGPGKARGGDFGLFAKGDLGDLALERAAFALKKPGELSPVVEGHDGFSVLQLQELKPKRVPPFEEVRAQIRARLGPIRQRKAFDDLRASLRKEADVKIDEVSLQ
ncbi:MAG TPA: peptidyl-prolyl cis-trans isomerase [Myxococcales bacterium]|jgi:peptidyl-prolyl cis-trans isomerase C|nr:peptidyl-prolyl cis-trans isomerase [Myxococcales bacterium]